MTYWIRLGSNVEVTPGLPSKSFTQVDVWFYASVNVVSGLDNMHIGARSWDDLILLGQEISRAASVAKSKEEKP